MKNFIKTNVRNLKLLTFLIFTIPFFSACAHEPLKPKKIMHISLGMEKQQVINQLGKPRIFRGSMINKFGQTIEVFEYKVDKTIYSWWEQNPTPEIVNYLFYFHDNKLVQWGEAGDWQKEADRISEIRFR
ncbi:TPA: hypothetical protein DEO28_04770 [Candidatus Dependentiae bacterium]|nr:hypothetical protein [Candidatus Dependentiae bacterium]HBZ73794.1 hypothetical protein [Candidatus Dependentiae bacterium]